MNSKRLPGKVLLPLNGHTVIGEVLTRCKRIAGVDEVVCAIPDNSPPELSRTIEQYVSYARGPEDDVLSRYLIAAIRFNADIIMRVTGDCPLICPELCEAVLDRRTIWRADYASNLEPRTFPQGLDCEVFTMKALNLATIHGPDEHVTSWMRSTPTLRRANVYNPWPIEGRLTLDTEDDYRTICAYFGHAPYEHLRAA